MALPEILPASEWASGRCGVFSGVSNSDYHADHASLSSTRIKKLAISPAHAEIPYEFGPTVQRSLDIGTLAHGFVLEGLTAEDMGFAVPPLPGTLDASAWVRKPEGMSFATKDGKAWREEMLAAGKTVTERDPDACALDAWKAAQTGRIVERELIDVARAVESAIFADPISREIGSRRGRSELSIRTIDPVHGFKKRARLDYADLGKLDFIHDLKTCQDAAPEVFGKDADSRGYLLQAAHYLEVAEEAGLSFAGFRFHAAATKAPHETSVSDLMRDSALYGRVLAVLREVYASHAAVLRTGLSPKRAFAPGEIFVPSWSVFAG